MSVPRANYFLIHRDTGQRYPVRGYVTIGRMSGDIVFPRDMKLSSQHCRLAPTKRGIGVTDLRSANGTYIDKVQISGDRPYLLKPKSELCVGEQVFTLQSVSVAVPMRKKKRRRQQQSSSFFPTFLVFCMAGLAIVLLTLHWKKVEGDNTLQSGQRELTEIFDAFQSLRDSLDHQTAAPRDIAKGLQTRVISRLSTLTNRWATFQPQDDRQRRLFTLQQRFSGALNSEAQAEMLYLSTGERKYLDEVDQWSDLVDQAAAEIRRQVDAKTIAAVSLPEPILSPFQMVEREMRQAFREYKKLGNQVATREVAEKDIGETLRKGLIPKLNAVQARLGAIKPLNETEGKRLEIEKKLVLAFQQQVKAMSIYYDTNDLRYAKDMNKWGDQIEKIHFDLKKLVDPTRHPASK